MKDARDQSWPVAGHEWAVSLLEHAIRSDRLHHAYLFTGAAQVGKTTLASAFAQALLCLEGAGFPCKECQTCRRIQDGRHPDVQVIAAERNNIQIEQVRALQSDAALTPLEGRYRVFIIREIERATLPAANALLKTLEEPPPQVILLLTSARRDQVLPTIISRCQVIALRPLPIGQVQSALETRWEVPTDRAALLARLSAGRLGWAVVAQTDGEMWQLRRQSLEDLLTLTSAGPFGRLAFVDRLGRRDGTADRSQEGEGHLDPLETRLGLWVSWWRDIWLIQHGQADAIVNLDWRVQLAQQAELYQPQQVEAALTDLLQTLHRLRANVNVRLAMDVLVLRMPRPAVA